MQQVDTRIKQVDELVRLAWESRISDSKQSLEFAQAAINLCSQLDYDKGLADAWVMEAFGYIRTSAFEKASSSLLKAESIYTGSQDFRGLAVLNEYRGIIERFHGNAAAALEYLYTALAQSRQTVFTENEITNLYQLGVTYRQLANYDRALEFLYESLSLAGKLKQRLMEGYNLNVIGSIYFDTAQFSQALSYFQQALPIREQAGDKWGMAGSLDSIGFTYFKLGNYNDAEIFCQKSFAITRSTGDKKGEANSLLHLAEISAGKNEAAKSVRLAIESLEIRNTLGDKRGNAEIYLFLAGLYLDSAARPESNKVYEWLKAALEICNEIQAKDLLSKTQFYLYTYYKQEKNYTEAIEKLEFYTQLEKELHRDAVNQKVLSLEISYKAEETRKEAVAVRRQNEELTALNKEIANQKEEIERNMANLRSTQAQLIHSEKMASLGALTAGIAHEIQNPLNFVNNFSELNTELISELKDELIGGNINSAALLANNVAQNLEKITHHGKRADAIVKAMLQHSARTDGQKVLANINSICDEYLRLCWHGIRAKNKAFNAAWKTEFDDSIGDILIIPQDVGRALLNLYSNAFYTINEKDALAGANYEPMVIVRTERQRDRIIITIEDNGTGIPANIIDKVFQPFFTTKPTGLATGLGLSLTYDIIKAHGGEIQVETREGEGSRFIVHLPVYI